MASVFGDNQGVDNIDSRVNAKNTHVSIHDDIVGLRSVYDFLGTLRVRVFFCGCCGVLERLRAEDNSDLVTIT